MAKLLHEFREFAVKGNVVDLAVGAIIGAAFNKIVDSIVNDLVMPVISRIVGGRLDFTNKFVVLGDVPAGVPQTLDALRKAGVAVFAWGNFVTVAINFLILAFVSFLTVKQINRLRRIHAHAEAKAADPVPPPEDVQLLREIRDSLRAGLPAAR